MTTSWCWCPREDCEGKITVTLEYEAGESNYGADADGNRGIAVRGYWSGTSADECSMGHTLTTEERAEAEAEAEREEGDPDDGDPSDWYDESGDK